MLARNFKAGGHEDKYMKFRHLFDLTGSQDLCFEHTYHGIKKTPPRTRNCSQKSAFWNLHGHQSMPIHSIANPLYSIYTRCAYQLRTVCVAGLHQIIIPGTPAIYPCCSIRFLAMLFQAIPGHDFGASAAIVKRLFCDPLF